MCDYVLKVEDLIVRYGDKMAVNGLSFAIRPGEVYCLLGPNGAGKTSTINAILGLVAYEGKIDILCKGPPGPETLREIGVVFETPVLLESLKVEELFEFVISMRGLGEEGVEHAKRLIKAFNLEEHLDKPVHTLSSGLKQRVAIALAFLHKPRLLIMDEPFNYLDARTARLVKELIQRHVREGGATLFTTHIMELAERICTRVCIIDKGRKVMEGPIEDIIEALNVGSLEEAFLKAVKADEEIRELLREL